MVYKWTIMSTSRNTGMHGITPEEKSWLVYKVQGGKCPLCREKLEVQGSAIDHSHDCPQSILHKTRTIVRSGGFETVEFGCKKCIRGVLHSACNGTLLFWLEKFPHLQNEVVREYLARRPFQFRRGAPAGEGPTEVQQ